ncbi:MAG: right-handed parallel beta-helix repeat-containing protein [Cryomorphaceae bacterium]|nr:MAG: right-handed parallel beta-helix repeat-containing protein [Cryomorphaceae bacterium]
MKYKLLLISILFIIGCSSGASDGGDVVGGGGNNGGGNNGGNTGGNTDGETDPDKYTDSSSSGDTTYYISFSDGDDSKDGKSESNAFKNLGKINSITFAPGDKIKFKTGDTWKGYFKVRGSGSSSSPITIESYGSSSKPIIDGNGYQASLFLENVEYIEVNNLEFKNEASHKKSDNSVKLMSGSSRTGQDERYGILALRFGAGKNINHLKVSNVKISNIYPTPSEQSYNHQGYGMRFESYNDGELNYFDGITIDNVDISLTGHYGIHIVNRMSGAQADFYHRNISITNSSFYDTGGSGIVFARSKNILVENSTFKGTGSTKDSRMWERGSGLWFYTCNDAIVQNSTFEDAYGVQDSFGAHIDWGNERVVIQYCLSKNNFGGFVEILGENLDCGYRYNISIGDGTRTGAHNGKIFWVSDFAGSNSRKIGSKNNFIYNNTVFVPSTNPVTNSPMTPDVLIRENTEDTFVYNNLIYIDSGASLSILTNNDSDLNFFRNNLYFGSVNIDPNTAFQHHSSEIFVDPKLINPGSSDPNDYKLQADSPAIGKGILINGSTNTSNFIQNNGGKDYFGNSVSNSEKPNIGAYNGS